MAIKATGRFGQIRGPFTKNVDLVGLIITDAKVTEEYRNKAYIELGISYAEKDAMIYGGPVEAIPTSLKFSLNGQEIWIGRTDIYETDDAIKLNQLEFLEHDAPASVLIEYRLYLDK